MQNIFALDFFCCHKFAKFRSVETRYNIKPFTEIVKTISRPYPDLFPLDVSKYQGSFLMFLQERLFVFARL